MTRKHKEKEATNKPQGTLTPEHKRGTNNVLSLTAIKVSITGTILTKGKSAAVTMADTS